MKKNEFLNELRKFGFGKGNEFFYEIALEVCEKALQANDKNVYLKTAGFFEGIWYAIGFDEPVTTRTINKKFVGSDFHAFRVKHFLEHILYPKNIKVNITKWITLEIYFVSKYLEADKHCLQQKRKGLCCFIEFVRGFGTIGKLFPVRSDSQI